jgi:hypothetical protein
MDFSQFDSRAASDKPRALHLKHPGTGKPIFDIDEEGAPDLDKPCKVLVLGIEGEAGQKAILASQRARVSEKRDPDNPLTVSEIHRNIVNEISPLIVGFENISRGDRPAKVPDDVEWFLNLQVITGQRGQLTFAEQIRAFASDRAAILGNSKAS